MMSLESVNGSFMKSLLQGFDGTGRPVRPIQVEALTWLANNYSYPGIVIQAPTGTGKSAIARALQIQTGADIIVPNNALLDQYVDSYPNLNALKGSEFYSCDPQGDHSLCTDCKYRKAKKRAKHEPTVFNPLSFIFSDKRPDTLIIDEAHKLEDFLSLIAGYSFSKATHPWTSKPDSKWLVSRSDYYNQIGSLYKGSGNIKKASENFQKAKRIKQVAELWNQNPDSYVSYITDDEQTFIVEPINLPTSIWKMFFKGVKKVILLSATIPPFWAKRVLGSKAFCYLDLPSPIPKENRVILPRFAGLTASSTPDDIANWIKKQREDFHGNCIVHTTYSLGDKLRSIFPDAHVHSKKTKRDTLRKFKRDGGLWIAAGASEGIDLADELCRVNLIPILPFANNRDPIGQARFKKDPYDYYLRTAIQFIQQCGRTTRGVDDYSTTICGDNRLVWLLNKCKGDLPKSFLEALVWK